MMMLYMIRELIKRTYNYFAYTTFCYGGELVSSIFLVKLETTTKKTKNQVDDVGCQNAEIKIPRERKTFGGKKKKKTGKKKKKREL